MSEEAAVAEAPAPAPVVEDAPAPEGPMDRSAAKAALRSDDPGRHFRGIEGLEEEGETPGEASGEPTRDAKGNLHSPEDGKFVQKPGEAAEAEGTDEVEALADESAEAAADTVETDGEAVPGEEVAEETASTLIRVELDPDHDLAHMGPISVADPQSEQIVKALANGVYHRRRQVESLEDTLAKTEAALDEKAREVVRLTASSTATQAWKQSPEYKATVARFHEIRESVGDEAADEYWAGKQHDLKALVAAETETGMKAVEQEANDRASKVWEGQARSRVDNLPPELNRLPEIQGWFDEEMHAFGVAVEAGHVKIEGTSLEERSESAHQAFAKRFASRLYREPAALEAMKVATKPAQPAGTAASNGGPPAPAATVTEEEMNRKIAEAKKAAVEEFRAAAAGKRKDTPPHPLAGAGGGLEGPLVTSTGQQDSEIDLDSMSPTELRNFSRRGARTDARSMMGR